MKTELITYNLKDRGREFRGQNRDYSKQGNLKRLVDAINSGATQEKVRLRDMHGFYGHNVRQIFGLIPPEVAIHEGSKIILEPDLATTHLKAYKDGTLEHQNEFTDSEGGEAAWRLYQKKIGGFSSAIDESSPEFYGFDYVLEPNFATNRGHTTFDGIEDNEIIQLQSAYQDHVNATFDKVTTFLSQHNGQLRGDFALTLDRINDLEQQLKSERVRYHELKDKRDEYQRVDHDKLAILDSANDFLTAELIYPEGSQDPERKLIIPAQKDKFLAAAMSHISRYRR